MKSPHFLLLTTTAALLSAVGGGNAAKILGMFFVPSISHQVVFQPIWRELSLRGHDVTVITPNPLKDPSLANLTEIDVSFSYEMIRKIDLSKTLGHWDVTKLLIAFTTATIDQQLAHPEVAALLRDADRKFDLVLVEYLNPIPSALSLRFRCPFVGVASLSTTFTGHENAGVPVHPVLHPELMTTFGDELTFAERVESLLYNAWYRWYYWGQLGEMNRVARRHLGEGLPCVDEIQRNVSVVLLNTNPVIHKPRPLPPSVLELGRMHMKAKRPLPQDLKDFLDASAEGAIYFSLGSNVKSVQISEEKRKTIMEAFGELPHRILWKFENDTLEGKPSNVKIGKWLPQQDLLGHPNVKLFVTQGGLQSMEESIENGVPFLAMPFFADQFYNAERIQALGLGLHLDFATLTKDSFKAAILEVIGNPKYKAKVKEIAGLLHDQPMSGLEKAVWWIEYVIRHKGAPHLKNPAVFMPWYKFLLLDVLGFLLGCVVVSALVTYNLLFFTKPTSLHKAMAYKMENKKHL